jgi:hypothetical protein
MINVVFDKNAKNKIRIEFAASGVVIFEGNKIDVEDIVTILSSTNHTVSYIQVNHDNSKKVKKTRQRIEDVSGS